MNKRTKISMILIMSVIFTLLSTSIAFSETGSTLMETVDSNGDVGWDTSIALDSSGNPHISYYDDTNNDLKYAYKDGSSWNVFTIDSDGSVGNPSIAIDSNDKPHISYSDFTNKNLKYTYYDGNEWHAHTVDNNGDVGYDASIALDSSDNPHISYYDFTNKDLKYAYYDGSVWNVFTIDSQGEVGWDTSIAIDSNGNPHISYSDFTNFDLKYAYYDGSVWNVSTADSEEGVGYDTSLAIDSNDNPHISYYDITHSSLKYAYYDGNVWNASTIDNQGEVGCDTSIALDSYDKPHISYFDQFNRDLKYAYYNTSEWNISTVDSEGDVGGFTSITIDSNDKPHISYCDLSNSDLKYYAVLYASINSTTNINIGTIKEMEICEEFIEITNIGLVNLEIAEIVSSSQNLVVEDIVWQTIYPGETKEVQILLSTSEVGPYNETIEIYSNDPDGVVTVEVSGQVAYSESNADLSNLDVIGETLDKEFDSDVLVYEITSSSDLDSIEITIETVNPLSTININDEISAGTTTKTVTLNNGENLIPIVVTSQNGTTEKAYILSANGTVSDADLLDLKVNDSSVSGFDKNTLNYTINVNNDIDSIDIAASPSDNNALMLINNTIYESENKTIDLQVGENIVEIMVVAQDSTTKTYTLVVNRGIANTDLSGITLDNGTLNETFDPFTYSYTVTVNNTVNSITITPTTEDSNATVKVNNKVISTPVNLEIGENIVTIEVTGVDGVSKKTYEIIVTKEAANAELSNLSVTGETLDKVFDSDVSVYEIVSSNNLDSIEITAEAVNHLSTININDEIYTGTTTKTVYLNNGENLIPIVVTSEDGTTERAYILSVNGTVSDADLLDLKVNDSSVSGFDKDTLNYTINVNNDVENINISASPSDDNVLILINNNIYQGGNKIISLDVCENIIEVMVVAQDSTTKTYILAVNRGTANANLNGITLSSGTLNETFEPFTYSYTATVNNSVDNIAITPTTVDINATVRVNNNDISTPVDLEVGENTVTIEVTGVDGVSKKTYEIIIIRREALEIINTSLPIGIVGGSYSAELSAEGGKAPYIWSATELPDGLNISPTTGEITGTPTTEGQYSVEIKVIDNAGIESSKTLNIKINLGCGNGGYIITPKPDSTYSSDLTDDALPIMIINEGVAGFKYLSATIVPIEDHNGSEMAIFAHYRDGVQIGLSIVGADFNEEKIVGAGFNVQPGDIIKIYVVDELSNEINHSPNIL